jgi:hypothetical protein
MFLVNFNAIWDHMDKIMSLAFKRYLHENVMLAFAPTLHEDLNHGL